MSHGVSEESGTPKVDNLNDSLTDLTKSQPDLTLSVSSN